MFNEEKTTQLGLYLLSKTEKGCMPYIKLIKLMYLCDREMIKRHNRPITGDRYVAMKFGPVLSHTFNMIISKMNFKKQENYGTGWSEHISTQGYDVSIKEDDTSMQDFPFDGEEKECIDHIVQQFMDYNQWDLVAYTHKNCQEWQSPVPNRVIDISLLDIGAALGKTDEELSILFMQA